MTNPARLLGALAVTGLLIAVAAAFIIAIGLPALAAEPARAVAAAVDPGIVQWAMLAAALSAGLSSLGAGYAVASVGSAAIGALTEKPELLGRVLIFVGLAEGIAIYGLIVAILILNRAG